MNNLTKKPIYEIRTYHDISINEKILNTGFLLVIGIGYLVALCNMYFSYQSLDGEAGFTLEDVIAKYHGSTEQSRLMSAINGAMESNFKDKKEKLEVEQWINHGAKKQEFEENIAPILSQNCLICHTPSINSSIPNLTNYASVSELARVTHNNCASLSVLIRNAHIHIFGISFILFFIGKIFMLTNINARIKKMLLIVPFVALILDISSWFLTRDIQIFAYSIVLFGAILGISVGLQIVLSIYQMWFISGYKY